MSTACSRSAAAASTAPSEAWPVRAAARPSRIRQVRSQAFCAAARSTELLLIAPPLLRRRYLRGISGGGGGARRGRPGAGARPEPLPAGEVLIQDGADRGGGLGAAPPVPGGPADQPVGDCALLVVRVAFAALVGQAVPQHAADELGVLQPDAQRADRSRHLRPVQIGR